jgi:hypothetical protein
VIYVSLPVHTQPAVIASQLRNFAFFLPEATVVLHVSSEAKFEMRELTEALRQVKSENFLINPERISTSWGNILHAHVANIRFICRQGDATKICMHASNDMLVRKGLAKRLASGRNFFNRRLVRPGTYWRFGQPALEDECLTLLRNRFGGVDVIGSQIEGSCYGADLLSEIAEIISAIPHRPSRIPYPREEVWFSTLATALAAPIDGSPYIFSEFHRFDRVFWKVLRFINPIIGTNSAMSDLIRRTVEFGLIKTGFHRISTKWVDSIANNDVGRLAPYEVLSDGNNVWRVFDRNGLFGVKRVPRRVTSPLRAYIDAMALDPESISRIAVTNSERQ